MFNLFTSLTINKSKMSAETSSRPLSSPKSQEVGSSSLVTSSPKLSLPAEDIDPLEITLLEEWQDLNFNGDQPPDDVDGIISSFDNHLIRWFEDQKDTGARAAEPDSLEDIQVVRINLSTPLHLEEDDTPRLQTDTPSNLGGDGSLNFGRGTPSRIELNSPVKLELDTPLRIELDSPRVEVDNQSRIRRDTPWVRDRVNRPQNDEPVTPLRTKPDTSFYQTPATTLNQVSDTPFIQKPTTPFNQTPIGVVNRSTPGGVLNTLRNVGRLFSRTPQTGEGEVERSHTDEIQKREVVIAPETGLTSFPEFWSGEEDGDEELVPDSLDHSQVTIDVNPVNGFDCAGTRHKNVSTLTYYKDLDLSERSTAFKGGNQRNKSVSPFSPAKKTSGNQISGSRNDADDYSVSVTVRSQVGDESFSSSFFQSELPNIVTMQRGDHAADVRQELWLSEDRLYTRDINRSYCWNGQHGGPPIDTSTPAREVSELHVLLRNGSRQTWHYDGGCYTEWRSSARMEGTQSGLAEVLDLNDPVHQPFGRGTGEAHDIPRKGGLAAEKGSRAWNDWLHWSEIENEVGRCPEEESSAVWFSTRVEEEDEDTEPSDEWIHITLSDIEEECYPLDEDRSLPSDHCSSYSENEYYSAVDISIRSLDIVQSTPGESPGKSFSGGLRKLIRSVAFDDGFFGTSSRNASGRHEEITQQQARHIDMERVQESPKTSRLLDILRKRRGREVKGAPTSEKNVRGNQFDEVIEPAMEVDLSGYDNISAGEGLSYSDISQDSLECSGMQQGRYQRLRFSDDSDTSAANSNNSYGSCEVTGSEGACERTQKYNGDGSSVQSEGWRDCDRLEQPSSPSKVLDPTCKSSDSRRVPNKSKVSWFRRALSFAYPKTSNHKKTEKFDGENCDTGLDVHPCRPELLDNSGETLCAWSTTGRKTEEQLDVSPKSEEDLLSSIRSSKWERDNRGVEWGNEQHVCLIAVNGRPERKPACGGEAVEVNGQCFKPCHESWLEGRIASISDRLRGQRGNQRYKLNLVNFMNQIASKAEKSRKGGEDVYLSFSEAELSQYSAGIDGGIDQDWLASETPFLGLAIRGYVMSDADIARESNDAEGYLIIDGDGDAAPDREDQVQEDFSFSVQKVGDDDGSPKRQAVNMDEIADLLNEGVEDQEPDQPDSNGLDHDGEVIVEDGIAEVKVEGVEAGVSIQWPGGDAGEGTEGVVETEDAPNTEDDGQEREETQKQEEPVLIEVNGAGEIAEDSLVDVEPVAEEKPVVQDEPEEEQQESEEDRPEIDDTPVVIDQAPEIIVDTSEDIEDQEVDDTPVVVEVDDTPVVVDTPEVDDDDDTPPEEPEIDDTPVIIDAPEPVEIEVNGNDINGEVVVEDLSPSSGNVAVDVTLGQEREEEERREVPAEDTTAKVVPVSRPKSSSSSLSDRIRAFERKQQENEPISRDRGQSHRLDSSKFLKYKSTDEPSEDEAPKPKTTGSKRLDMSRFALFQNQPGDAADGPPKKNFTIKPANKSPRSGSQGVSSTDQSNKCLNCEKRVYPMDKISADGKPFHKWCFRCAECKKTLTLGNYAALNSVLYCKPHFTQLFKLHGNYNTGFNQGMRTSPQSSSAVSQQ